MAGGRPSKYNPEYCQQVIDHCSAGKSLKSFACSIDVHMDTLLEWKSKYPEFSVAYETAKQKAEMWWEDIATAAVNDKRKYINVDLYKFMAKVRFRWSDAQQVEITTNDSKELEELKEKYKQLINVKASS